jgi:hypothetical protein
MPPSDCEGTLDVAEHGATLVARWRRLMAQVEFPSLRSRAAVFAELTGLMYLNHAPRAEVALQMQN